MSVVEFSQEALIATLGHLVDHKAQGTNYVGTTMPHRILWLRTYLVKHYL
jgi:hypothetical protein